jgi:hypothetical protein
MHIFSARLWGGQGSRAGRTKRKRLEEIICKCIFSPIGGEQGQREQKGQELEKKYFVNA